MQDKENWTCAEEQKLSALTWTQEQGKKKKIHPLRYLGRIVVGHWREKPAGRLTAPDEYTKHFVPLFSTKYLGGRAEHWISEDGITVYTYYSEKMFELTTRFADDSSIVTITIAITKPKTLYLEVQPNFSDSWRLHREEVKKRVQSVRALERSTIDQFLAYYKYWGSYKSSLQIPIMIILAFTPGIVVYLLSLF